MSKLLKISFYALPDKLLNNMRRWLIPSQENFSDLEFAKNEINNLSFKRMYQLHIEPSLPFYEFDEKMRFLQDENCDLALLENLFEQKSIKEKCDYPWEIVPGQQYRHFKNKIVQIIAVVKHTEYPTQQLVIYEEVSNKHQWARPLEMFCSKVDKEKYPDAKQEWRFELYEKP